jgi:hypothetical protein
MASSVSVIQEQLLAASELLSSLCLPFSAKWAAEQVIGLGSHSSSSSSSSSCVDAASSVSAISLAESCSSSFIDDEASIISNLARDEGLVMPSTYNVDRSALALARSLFQLRELQRVAHVLQPCRSGVARFIRRYALYLHGEKKQEQTKQESPGMPRIYEYYH